MTEKKGFLHASMIHDSPDPSYLKRGPSRSLAMTWELRERKSPSPESSPIEGEEITWAREIGARNNVGVEEEDS